MWDEYLLPASLEEALEILEGRGEEARIIAGGTDLVLQSQRGQCPAKVMVDITRIPGLDYIEERDGSIYIGAQVTHRQVAASPPIRSRAGVLAEACGSIGGAQIRNVGTLVGNVVNASPAGDAIPPLWVLGASVTLASRQRGLRELPLEEFFLGVGQTALQPDEIVVAIRFSALQANERATFLKLALRRAQATAVVNVALLVGFDGQRVSRARIALGSVAPTIVRAFEAEESLVGRRLMEEAIAAAGQLAAAAARPIDDIRGSATYRRAMVRVLTMRSLRQLRDGASEHRSKGSMKPREIDEEGSMSRDIPGSAQQASGTSLEFTVNGQRVSVAGAHDKTLLRVLREDLGLTGTKEACSEGECGACTVLVDGKSVVSCIYPALKAQGREVITIEGLGRDNRLDPIQQAFVDKTGLQCGYCIPGMIISAKALLDENPHPTREEIEKGISGNLCRCTGYYQIMEAIELAAKRLGEKGGRR